MGNVREAFRQWLNLEGYTERTRVTQWTQANRLEKDYGDLDAAFDRDGLEEIRAEFEYSKEDERASRPNPSKFQIDGDLYSNLAGYRATLNYFVKFRDYERQNGRLSAEAAVNGLNPADLERLKALFLQQYSDFSSLTFAASTGAYWRDQREAKQVLIDQFHKLVESGGGLSDSEFGSRAIDIAAKIPQKVMPSSTRKRLVETRNAHTEELTVATALLLRGNAPVAERIEAFVEKVWPLLAAGHEGNLPYQDIRSIPTFLAAFVRPSEAIAVRHGVIYNAGKALLSRSLLANTPLTAEQYREVADLAERLFVVMRDRWNWAPRDLWDVQGFIAATCKPDIGAPDEINSEEDEIMMALPAWPPRATNVIYYGPPGTGKTFITAARAVELCDGPINGKSRDDLMKRYRELVSRKRIGFVTFHQSYSYEDFVEGLRPETPSEEDLDETRSGGFTLKPYAGIFRRIAELARDNRGPLDQVPGFNDKRRVYKMSLGRRGQDESTTLYRSAIDGGYTVLGWGGDVDWSEEKFSDLEAIRRQWREDHPDAPDSDSNILQTNLFRNKIQAGDLIIVADGNSKFRAVGAFVGPYEFVLSESHEYNHRRAVKWLWTNDQGRPSSLIYGRPFTQSALYQLDPDQIQWPALEQLMTGGGEIRKNEGRAEPYVLIIDEINRANVSKVFGELITLIEPDKRVDQENGLEVTLPYSQDSFGVPSNLHIVGTMNTADRSIALLDTALRRRFDFIELLPDLTVLDDVSVRVGIDLSKVLGRLNERIEYLFDREHQIGHAFFIGCASFAELNGVMRNKVIPLLAEYFYEDWEKVRSVLAESSDSGGFIIRTQLLAPKTHRDHDQADMRWRYSVRDTFTVSAYEQLMA